MGLLANIEKLECSCLALLLPPKSPNMMQACGRFGELADQWCCGLQVHIPELSRGSQVVILNEVDHDKQHGQKYCGVLCDGNDQHDPNEQPKKV